MSELLSIPDVLETYGDLRRKIPESQALNSWIGRLAWWIGSKHLEAASRRMQGELSEGVILDSIKDLQKSRYRSSSRINVISNFVMFVANVAADTEIESARSWILKKNEHLPFLGAIAEWYDFVYGANMAVAMVLAAKEYSEGNIASNTRLFMDRADSGGWSPEERSEAYKKSVGIFDAFARSLQVEPSGVNVIRAYTNQVLKGRFPFIVDEYVDKRFAAVGMKFTRDLYIRSAEVSKQIEGLR